jgi:hypothetical protein
MLKELVRHFESAGELPVEIHEIVDYIRSKGIVEQINFYPSATMNAEVVIGVLDRYTLDGPGPREIADIYYPATLPPTSQRIVQAKELMNVCDNGGQAAATPENVVQLVKEMTAPPGLTATPTEPTVSDQLALTWAMFVLFPKPLRETLLPQVRAGKATAAEIAKLTAVPEIFMPWLLSDSYEAWYKRLIEG